MSGWTTKEVGKLPENPKACVLYKFNGKFYVPECGFVGPDNSFVPINPVQWNECEKEESFEEDDLDAD